jgi:signal transduction histidine kinase
MRFDSRKLLIVLAVVVLVQAGVGITSSQTLQSTYTNIGQAVLQAVMAALMARNAYRSTGQARQFWALMSAGALIWLMGQSEWIYYEQILRTEVPIPTINDLWFFMHTVPMIAAVAIRPQAPKDNDQLRLRFGQYDLVLLLLWWFFIYSFVLFPWEFIYPSAAEFLGKYTILYTVENLILIAALAISLSRTKRNWREVYFKLLIAASIYAVFSAAANFLIYLETYRSGATLIDAGLTASMCYFIYAAYTSPTKMELEDAGMSAQEQMQWHSALAYIALLSMPFFAMWATFRSYDEAVEQFRMVVVLTAMVMMLAVFFLKQSQLDIRLMRLLRESRRAYDDLQQLQGHLLQAEKLAAIGRFVAGAAHEINNPLTAIVGYSDLLASHEKLDKEHKDFAEKILQQARRTKSLVQNLLTFAKETPLQRRPINVNAIVGHALQLHELDFAGKNVQIICRMHADLPHVVGDENQLLQVFLHIMNNAVDAMLEKSDGGTLVISTDASEGRVLWSCSDTGPGVPDPTRIFDPFFTTKPVGKGTGLGLSASYGIIRDHGGQISCHNRSEGGATFVISLPAADPRLVQQPPRAKAQSSSIQ